MNPQDPVDSSEDAPHQSGPPAEATKQLGVVAISDPVAMSNPLATMEPGEEVICEITRHPIGILADYVAVGFLLLVVGITDFVAMPHLLSDASSSRVFLVSILVFVAAAVVAGAFLLVASIIYRGNRWIVTNDSITQVTQTGLFTKHSSQLSFEHLEDVTVEQNGLVTEMFHYGVISAETAGAVDKFTFLYCPKPAYYAKQILAARERFELAPRGAKPV